MKALVTLVCLFISLDSFAFFGARPSYDVKRIYKSAISVMETKSTSDFIGQTSFSGILRNKEINLLQSSQKMILATEENTVELEFRNKSTLDLLRNVGKRIEVYGSFDEDSKLFIVEDYLTLN